jgi:hypothetical protein
MTEPIMPEDPIIELEPRGPFSWRIVAVMVGAWLLALVAVMILKSAMLRLLLPLIALLFVVYLTVCTLYYLKNRK